MKIQNRLLKLNRRMETHKHRLERVFSYRLGIALIAFGLMVAISVGVRSPYLIVALAVLLVIFVFFVQMSRRIRKHLARLLVLNEFYERQQLRLNGAPPGAAIPKTRSEGVALDLDFFGEHSVYSQIDETLTEGGRLLLASRMMNPYSDPEIINQKQNIVRELAGHHGFLRKLMVMSRTDANLRNDQLSVQALEKSFLDSGFRRRHLLLWVLFFIYVASCVAAFFIETPIPVGGIWLAYFVFSMFALNKCGEVFNQIQELGLQLEKIQPIFLHLEKWSPRQLNKYVSHLAKAPLSRELKKINRIIDFLSVQTHPLVTVVVNGLVPWSYFFAERAEKVRSQVAERWEPLLKELFELEVMSSLAMLYRFQTQVFPIISLRGEFQGRGLRHPLLSTGRSVSNDFTLQPNKRVILITGSNMSGKSTFLRTIGVNQTLALMGAPVFADAMITPPIVPKSCIRVSDSVRDGVSYFYAETLRLKEILADAERGVLILIDEMFRGTNNRERLLGSQAVVGALLKTPSIGFISTHDLELTKLADDHPPVDNWHFRDDLDESGIRFSYKIHAGPCPTTNAIKIMRSLGLPVPT